VPFLFFSYTVLVFKNAYHPLLACVLLACSWSVEPTSLSQSCSPIPFPKQNGFNPPLCDVPEVSCTRLLTPIFTIVSLYPRSPFSLTLLEPAIVILFLSRVFDFSFCLRAASTLPFCSPRSFFRFTLTREDLGSSPFPPFLGPCNFYLQSHFSSS